MAATYTDKNGVVWTTIYDAPSFTQLQPWQGYAPRYAEAPHLFAFTESGLHEDLEEYAKVHSPLSVPAASTGASVTYKNMTDARGIVWILRNDSLHPNVWTGFTNSSRYGAPKPTVMAASESLARSQIAAYAVGHTLLPVVPVPTRPPPGGKPTSNAGVIAVAAGLLGLGVLFLSRRS